MITYATPRRRNAHSTPIAHPMIETPVRKPSHQASLPNALTLTGLLLILLTTHFLDRSPSPLSLVPHALLSSLSVPIALLPPMAHPSKTHHHHHRASLHTSSAPHSTVAGGAAMTSARPPSKKQLGNAGWTLIHSIAANFPDEPSESEQGHAKAFLKSISKLYPCRRCRHHFDKFLASSPPDLSSRDSFVLWACTAHNDVNRRNGKSEFPCEVPALEKRWGDCGCQRKK